MQNIKRLGEQFSSDQSVFTAKQPKAFDEALAEKLEQEAIELLRQEQISNSARDYRKLFTKLTNKKIDSNIESMLNAFEQQFGKTLIQETVEYMATVNMSWELRSFNAYLIKALQGKHKQNMDQFSDRTSEDISIDQLDNYIAKNTRKQLMEIRQWERERNR